MPRVTLAALPVQRVCFWHGHPSGAGASAGRAGCRCPRTHPSGGTAGLQAGRSVSLNPEDMFRIQEESLSREVRRNWWQQALVQQPLKWGARHEGPQWFLTLAHHTLPR